MTLSIILCTPDDFPGRIISAVEGDPICHVAITNGEWAIAEEPSGLWARPLAHYGTARQWPVPITEAQAQNAWSWLLDRIGTGYSYNAVALDGLHIVLHMDLHYDQNGNYDCSGVIAMALFSVNYKPFGAQDPRSVTPADWDVLSKKESTNG